MMFCRNFSGAQLQWESVASNTNRSQAATQQQQQQQHNHANHSQSKTSRLLTDDQSDVKLVITAVISAKCLHSLLDYLLDFASTSAVAVLGKNIWVGLAPHHLGGNNG